MQAIENAVDGGARVGHHGVGDAIYVIGEQRSCEPWIVLL